LNQLRAAMAPRWDVRLLQRAACRSCCPRSTARLGTVIPQRDAWGLWSLELRTGVISYSPTEMAGQSCGSAPP